MPDIVNILKQVALYFYVVCASGYSDAVTIGQHWKLGPPDVCKTAPDQSLIYNLNTFNAENLIQCLSYMQPKDGSLRTVSYNSNTKECILVDDPNTFLGNTYTTKERADRLPVADNEVNCDTQWTKAFEVAADGNVLFGDIVSITAEVKKGVELRIQIVPDFFLEVDNLAIKSGVICTSSVFVLSKSAWDMFEASMFWRYTMVCSDGKVYQGRTYLGKNQDLSPLQSSEHSIWYTRHVNMVGARTNPAYCTDSTFQPVCGSVADVISAAEQGMVIRLAYDFGTSSFFLNTVFRLEVEPHMCGVVGQIPWKLGRKASTGRYSVPYYWYIALFDTFAVRAVSRWYVGDHSFDSESSGTIPNMSWFVESCWNLVYKHNANGDPLIGSKKSLINSILIGRRVRIVFDSYTIEAENVVISNGSVTAQLLSQIHTPTANTFVSGDLDWKWVRISSDGTYAVDLYEIGSSNMKGQTISTIQAGWVVDNRSWRLMLRTDSNGNEILGSKSNLKQAVQAGSRLRCVVKVQTTTTLAVTADNTEINNDEHIAVQVFRLIEFEANGDPQFIPFWKILLITTKGEMKETRWTVGKHEHRGDIVSHVSVDWFVD